MLQGRGCEACQEDDQKAGRGDESAQASPWTDGPTAAVDIGRTVQG